MSTAPATPVTPAPLDENILLVEFEQQAIPKHYRKYYVSQAK
jgi:hypothetical protein